MVPETKRLIARFVNGGTVMIAGALKTSTPGGMETEPAPSKVNGVSVPGTMVAFVPGILRFPHKLRPDATSIKWKRIAL